MKRKRSVARLVLASALSLGVSLTACSRKQPVAARNIVLDRPVFHFDYRRTRSLTLSKADPLTGDHWMARVERRQSAPSEFHDDDAWSIASYSGSASLADRLGNRILILHLLDTLSTLHPVETVAADGASPAVRANYGLSPPRFALSWEAAPVDGGQGGHQEVEIGAPVTGSTANSEAYGSFPPDTRIYKLDGAALSMLDYIKSFQVLRHQILSPIGSDDVEQIEIRRPGSPGFYAQRDGDVWADRRHRPWSRRGRDVQAFLERITHLRIRNFIDDPAEAAKLGRALAHPLAEVVLTPRPLQSGAQPTSIRLARAGTRAVATVSSRAGAVFELYPGALAKLAP